MRDFVSVDLRTHLTQIEVHQRLTLMLPRFTFRMGDSDANGLYVSGIDDEQAQVKVWLGEDSASLTLSLRGWRAGVTNREEAKQLWWDRLTNEVLPSLGEVVKIVERD